MPADIISQKQATGPSPMLHRLTLTVAGLTLIFALFSIIVGHRFAALQADHLKAEKDIATSEAASVQEMETSLDAATATLKAAQQALSKEKAAGETLRRQLSAVAKDLEKTKTDLVKANQRITDLKAALPAEEKSVVNATEPLMAPQPAPSTPTNPPPALSPQPVAPQSAPAAPLPAAVEAPANQPTTSVPAPVPAPQPLGAKPDNEIDAAAPPKPQSSVSGSQPETNKETIVTPPKAPPTDSPTAD